MDIVVKGRNVEVPDHYRELVEEKIESKIAKYLARYDGEAIDIDVELYHEPNPRQTDHAQRVEITCRPKGTVMRAEAYPGEDPQTVKTPEDAAAQMLPLVLPECTAHGTVFDAVDK